MDNRTEYLQSLADEHEISLAEVLMFADLLGPEEDYDGLVTELSGYADAQ